MSDFIIPIVSVIVPTTHDREAFNQRVLNSFKLQDYPNKEIQFDYGDGKVGEKRNRLCEKSMGEIVVHMDSDDVFQSNWISQSVAALINSEADIAGLSKLRFYDMRDKAWYTYNFSSTQEHVWIAGGTFCYWKNFWRNNPFPDKNISEDNSFLIGVVEKPKIFAHDYIDGFVASVHSGNTATKSLFNARYTRCSEEEEGTLVEVWRDYALDL